MKQTKVYDVIFPIWILLFFPPVIILSLIGNLLIDSLVIISCFFVFKLDVRIHLKEFYKKIIIPVLLFGFLADIIGALILLIITMNNLVIPYKLISAINYDPLSNFKAAIIVIITMLISSVFIFLFNYQISLKKLIVEKEKRLKVAISIAVITMPWTFLLPTKWFYHGL